ncbi:hypothetical protein FDI41_gp44 [Arthrobacter phage Piccoletto]|uniref:Uncharacterized protein n=1 Tax=Arthrobacter phage Piccoletto TaxID=2024282 RepID=A0A222ZAD8_9CAUD|nr:hypothetical protein FDI41_gp44 [Arthrobacter phage Piccoletto]ASR80675.1 hypothetical protein SEA_PICCOLETTO_44 [Arthrobacter phage Piccoletto]
MTERHYVDEVVAADPSVIHRVSSIYGETYTDKLNHIGAQLGVYRQCSIGYHSECSVAEQRGDDCPCACKCHVDPFHERVKVARLAVAQNVYKIEVETDEILLGWLAPHWNEGEAERWISIEPDAIEPLYEALRKARGKLSTSTPAAPEGASE